MEIISSKYTSVNKTKLPRVYNALNWEQILKDFGDINVLDYGCGRYTDHIQNFLTKKEIKDYIGYDPYWTNNTLQEALDKISYDFETSRKRTIIICSNVFNIIPDWKEVTMIHRLFTSLYYAPYFITVYEGKGDSIGRISKKDCWQWNKPLKEYEIKFETIKKRILTSTLYSKYIK